MKILTSKKFEKLYKKSPPHIKEAFQERLRLFIKDRFHKKLNNHPLHGQLDGTRSINISGDWRAWFTEDKERTIFVAIGTHAQLYG